MALDEVALEQRVNQLRQELASLRQFMRICPVEDVCRWNPSVQAFCNEHSTRTDPSVLRVALNAQVMSCGAIQGAIDQLIVLTGNDETRKMLQVLSRALLNQAEQARAALAAEIPNT